MIVMDKTGRLPMIKCSNCGVDIDIERMADHLCGPGLVNSIANAPPRSFHDAFSNMSVNQSVPAPFRQKPIPRPIDSGVANIPYLSHPPVPIGMQVYNRPTSPAATGRRAAPQHQRSATIPPRANSPELIMPQECAFPAFPITTKPSLPRVLDNANTDTWMSANGDKVSQYAGSGATSYHEQPSNLYEQQPSNMTTDPKPFTSSSSNRKLSSSGRHPANDVFSTASRPLEHPSHHFATQTTIAPESPSRRPPSHDRNKSVSAANRPLEEIGSVRTQRPMQSRNGLPPTSSKYDIPRSASAQGHRSGRSIHDIIPPLPGIQDANGHVIPRSISAMGSRDRKVYEVPPLPIHMQHYRSESQNTARHTPSDSNSSTQSENSQAATSSSRSSPPTSTASMSPQRHDYHDIGSPYAQSTKDLGNGWEKPMGRAATKSFSRPSYAQPTLPILSPETFEQVTAGPWQSELKAQARQPPKPLDTQAVYHTNGPYRDNPPYPPAPESPLDPDLKDNRLPMLKTQIGLPSATPDFQEATRSAITPSTHKNGLFPDSLAPSLMPRTTLRRAATTSKGKCRGCGELITGKSVSSADGRLTGRWHKQCFTCKTCSEPFPTMDFYVIGNDPYCNRHYHRLNNSLCSRCDRGIEGQYVDNDRQKFHPHCFTCSECHLILRDTYFDLNGRVFCERHAFRLDALPPFGAGRRYPEKRSTRLMMI